MNTTREQIEASRNAAPAPRVEAPTAQNANGTPSSTPKTPKAKAEPKACGCGVPGPNGCNGGKTTRMFAPGHDAKLVGHLTREVVSGGMTLEQATNELSTKSGGSKTLLNKLATAVPREQAKVNSAKKREQDRIAAKEAKARTSETVKEQVAAAKVDREAREKANA